MYCNNCGHQNDEKTKFCVECGSKLEMGVEAVVPQPAFCSNCGSEIAADSQYCEKCGAGLAEPMVNAGKHKGKRWIGRIVSLLLVIVLACGSVFGYKLLSNPMFKLQSAVKNTFGAKSMAFEISGDYDGDDLNMEGELELDIDKEYFCLHVDVDVDDDEVEVWARYEDSGLVLYYKYRGGKLQKEDVPYEAEEAIAAAFDALKGETDIAETLEDLYADEWDEMKDEIGEYIQIDKVEKIGKRLAKKLASKQNMEKILGYSMSKNGSEKIYSFKPDLYELVLFLIDNSKEMFTEDGYDDILDAKEEVLDEGADSEDIPTIKLSFFTKGKYWTGYTVECEDEDHEVEVTLSVSDINKTKVDFPG